MNYKDLMSVKEYTYLLKILEPTDNSLRILVERCEKNKRQFFRKVSQFNTIEVDENLPLIQLDFDSYVSYSIINESFTVLDDYEVYKGNTFRIYKKSRYLDFVKQGTVAEDIYPDDEFIHYEIAYLNHIIDVVSYEEPIVSEVARELFFNK
jgi:hypothetical protein